MATVVVVYIDSGGGLTKHALPRIGQHSTSVIISVIRIAVVTSVVDVGVGNIVGSTYTTVGGGKGARDSCMHTTDCTHDSNSACADGGGCVKFEDICDCSVGLSVPSLLLSCNGCCNVASISSVDDICGCCSLLLSTSLATSLSL